MPSSEQELRVVIDTNIFISGIFWKGKSYQILNLWRRDKFSIVISAETITELIRVLRDFKIKLSEDAIKELVTLILENAIMVYPQERLNIVKDESDNRFLEAAIAGNAKCVVTQDNQLLTLAEFRGIKILNPADFLETLA